ncbi:MAG: VOC family protein [Pseudomonadota bacterium]
MSLVYPGSNTLEISTQTPPGSQPIERPEAVIKVDELTYLLWEAADFETQKTFLLDFGMLLTEESMDALLMRGYSSAPYNYVARKAAKTRFVGVGFSVLERADLEKLAQANNTSIEPLQRSGGGEVVRLTDPAGVEVEVTFGVERVAAVETRSAALPANTPNNKVRINQGHRAPLQAAPVMKLGHCVMGANNMMDVCQWYMRNLGLIPTDVLCIADGSPMLAFMRLDRGDKPADHHSIVIGKGQGNGYIHSAYEVIDLDALGQGQQYLKAKKYQHVWGIGRHILGSQLFDYWKDPQGYEFEHYADSDVFTSDYPTAYHPLDSGNIYAWGQDMPSDMLRPSLGQLLSIFKGIREGSVTFKWLKTAMKSVSRPPRPWL